MMQPPVASASAYLLSSFSSYPPSRPHSSSRDRRLARALVRVRRTNTMRAASRAPARASIAPRARVNANERRGRCPRVPSEVAPARWTLARVSRGSNADRGAVSLARAYAKEPPTFDPLGILDVARGDDGVFAPAFGWDKPRTARASGSSKSSVGGEANFDNFFKGKLPGKIATVFALLVLSRVGTYIPISGVDRAAFAESLSSSGGMMGYVDTLTGGSISKLGIFSLGIVPYINSSIIFQLLGSVFPELKKLQKEEGEAGRRKFQQYQRCVDARSVFMLTRAMAVM